MIPSASRITESLGGIHAQVSDSMILSPLGENQKHPDAVVGSGLCFEKAK